MHTVYSLWHLYFKLVFDDWRQFSYNEMVTMLTLPFSLSISHFTKYVVSINFSIQNHYSNGRHLYNFSVCVCVCMYPMRWVSIRENGMCIRLHNKLHFHIHANHLFMLFKIYIYEKVITDFVRLRMKCILFAMLKINLEKFHLLYFLTISNEIYANFSTLIPWQQQKKKEEKWRIHN